MKQLITIILLLQMVVFGLEAPPKPLKASDAFNVSIKQDGWNLRLDVKLGKQIYIYHDKVKLEILEPKKLDISAELQLPEVVDYHGFKVINSDFNLTIPMGIIKSKAGQDDFKIRLTIQGCSELGICYRPNKTIFATDKFLNSTPKDESKIKPKVQKKEIEKIVSLPNNISEQDSIANILKGADIIKILTTFFIFGLLLSMTPCIFPMIPILSSIIVSQGEKNMSAKKGFMLSLIYVLSMSIAYTGAGVMAGMFGSNIQTAFQNPWVLISFSAVFVALAFSMFGYFDIELPKSMQTKLNKKSNEAEGKGIIGVAIMGFLSALIVGPCVAAPLAGALIYIGQTGDAVLGGIALFTLSIGMGMPLLLIGIGAGKYMPRPGGWMETTKAIFGVLMLGVAIWMLSRILDANVIMFMWAFLTIAIGIYMGALESQPQNSSGIKKFIKVVAFIVLVFGVIMFIGAINGGEKPLKPLENFKISSNTKIESHQKFKKVDSLEGLNKEIENSNKPILIDFYANWCVSCKELDEETFANIDVQRELKNFTLIQIDVTQNSEEDKKIMIKYKVSGPPSIIFYKNRKELKNFQLVGFIEPTAFIKHLQKILINNRY